MKYFATVELPLPDPKQFVEESLVLGWRGVFEWTTAAIGVLVVVMIVKSFMRG